MTPNGFLTIVDTVRQISRRYVFAFMIWIFLSNKMISLSLRAYITVGSVFLSNNVG